MGGYRNILIRLVTFLGGIYFFLEFLLPEEINGFKFGTYHQQITNGFIVVGTMAFALGIINLLMAHGSKILYRRKGSLYSAALIIGMFVMLVVSIYDWRATSRDNQKTENLFNLASFALQINADDQAAKTNLLPIAQRTKILYDAVNQEIKTNENFEIDLINDQRKKNLANSYLEDYKNKLNQIENILNNSPESLVAQEIIPLNQNLAQNLNQAAVIKRKLLALIYEFSKVKAIYKILYEGLFTACGSAMFALLGFYIASAAFRAFRIRSMESAIMLTAATLVMLGQIPFGLWISEDLPTIRLWLLQVPSSAAFRAIKIGASVALLSMACRMWLSIESGSFAENKKEV